MSTDGLPAMGRSAPAGAGGPAPPSGPKSGPNPSPNAGPLVGMGIGHAAVPAAQLLQRCLQALYRARMRQLLVERLSGALLIALAIDCLLLAATRLSGLAWSAWQLTAVSLVLAALVAVLSCVFRHPSRLQVAIQADLKLGLAQRLSTAVEFASAGVDRLDGAHPSRHEVLEAARQHSATEDADAQGSSASERLALQVAPYLRRLRAERVFALHLDNRLRLIPVLALLLALIAVLDPNTDSIVGPSSEDRLVTRAAETLLEGALELRTQTRGSDMAHAAAAASDMQTIGERLRNEGLSRGEALSRVSDLGAALDAHQRAALERGRRLPIDRLQLTPVRSVGGGNASRLQSMRAEVTALRNRLQSMRDQAAGGDAAAGAALSLGDLPEDAERLQSLGMDREAVEGALRQLAEGNPAALERLLDELRTLEQALNEAAAIDAGRNAVQQARSMLDPTIADGSGASPGAAAGTAGDGGEGGAFPAEFGADASPGNGSEGAADDELFDAGSGAGSGVGSAARAASGGVGGQVSTRPSRLLGEQSDDGVLPVQGRLGAGDMASTEARALPRPGAPAVPLQSLDASYARQLESVLAKEDYPPSVKRFVRDYFLGLSSEEGRDEQR